MTPTTTPQDAAEEPEREVEVTPPPPGRRSASTTTAGAAPRARPAGKAAPSREPVERLSPDGRGRKPAAVVALDDPAEEPVEDVLTPDPAAFERVVRELETPLLRYALRFLSNLEQAQDTVQEAFFRLHQHLVAQGEFRGNVSGWLYRVTHNLAMDHLRRDRRAREHLEKTMQESEPTPVAVAAPRHAARDSERLAREKLRELKPREQQIVILKVEQDLSYKEIAEVMELSVGNVGYILHHALKKLARMLQEEGAV